MAAGALTKGIGFVNVKAFVHARWGDAAWSSVMNRVRPTDREELQSVVAVGWYPLALYARLIRALDETHGAGDLALVVQLGRFEAERDLTTLHRLMFRLANPATVVEKTADYWRKFHDSGSWEMKRISGQEIHGTLTDWGVVDHALCRELVGYLSRLLELVGAQGVILEHPICRARGHERCFFRARWGAVAENTLEPKPR